MGGNGSPGRWSRIERWLVVLVSAHSFAVGFFLLFLTRWGTGFGGWGEVEPLFFARQAGIFHIVVAVFYLIEFFRYRGVTLLVLAKTFATVFLLSMWLLGEEAWSVPLSALGDAAMGVLVALVHRRARAES